MRHLQYTELFRELARRHKEIQHTNAACHFLRIHLSGDFVQAQLDLREFYASLRSKIKSGVVMVLQSYDASYGENLDDYQRKFYTAGLIILDKVANADMDKLDEVYDRTERIGEEVMAAAMLQISAAGTGYRLYAKDITAEKVGPLGDQFHGTRFDFRFTGPAGSGLVFNPDKFID
jgi:hypothetical protein